jgi:hypothetical protein
VPQHAAQARQQGTDLVRLDAQHDQILRTEILRTVAGLQGHRDSARRIVQRQALRAYGLQVRATRHHPHRMACIGQLHRHAAAHGPRAHHNHLHAIPPAAYPESAAAPWRMVGGLRAACSRPGFVAR